MASIWYGVDPLAEKYINIGSYIYCHSSPIMLIDPTGEGDYYNKSGKLLGNDGVKNNKAYLATSVLTDKKGIVTSATDKSLLPVTNDVLNQYANTVAQESSGNKQESYALASAISNLSKYKKKSILATLKTEGIYGFRDGGYKTDYEGNAEYSMEAVINALTNGKDYSNGAIRWDGFDLAARGFNHPKPKTAGVEISPADFMHFKAAWPAKLIKAYSAGKYTSFSSNFHSGSHPATYGSNKGYVLYSSSAAYGRTMFWKANLNATRKVAGKIETYIHTKFINMNSKFFVIVFLLSLFFAETFAQDNIPNNILLDKTCNVKYNKRNDSTLVMTVSINGHAYKDSFLFVKGVPYSKYLPKYFGRYKKSLIFINGESVNYRRLTVYELNGCKIRKGVYEMELCSNRNSSVEYYLFFYNNQPIKIISSLDKTLYKPLSLSVEIESDKISTIESCKGKFKIRMVKGKCYSLK
jgi:YD repeat protein